MYAFIVLGWSKSLGVTLPTAAQAYLDGLNKHEKITKAKAALSSASA